MIAILAISSAFTPSNCLLRQASQSFIHEKHCLPLIAEDRSKLLVQPKRFLVPVNHFPVYAVTTLVDRNARYRGQQCRSDTAVAKRLPHEQIFQKQSASHPGRIVSKKEGVSRGLPLPFGDERVETRIS